MILVPAMDNPHLREDLAQRSAIQYPQIPWTPPRAGSMRSGFTLSPSQGHRVDLASLGSLSI